MTEESTVAIVGSGIAAAAIASTLTKRGYDVTVFEKGPEYPYPHEPQFRERVQYLYDNPAYELPPDLNAITLTGDYRFDLERERAMVVGGSATHWTAITPRMNPHDFQTRTLYGFGDDWPISYADLETYYCRAETLLGVSGTDADNPFAPWRSRPYPLPPFELSYADQVLAARLLKKGIKLHTTPQARTRARYDGRPACANFGTCEVCPIGARYSPTHHLFRAKETGLCKIRINCSVRRIVFDRSGQAKGLVYRLNESVAEQEHAAKVIIVTAGAIESARLLLLSTDPHHPNGIGNHGGQVGRNLVFHHLWDGSIHYGDRLYAGRLGPATGQSQQFLDPPTRGRHGGIKVEYSSHFAGELESGQPPMNGAEVVEALRNLPHRRGVFLHAESVPTSNKYVTLSNKRDRFGDRFAHIHYESAEFDYDTHRFALELFEQFALATGGEKLVLKTADQCWSGGHHMGTCRMGQSARDSVVDSFGKVHDTSNLYVVGASNFVGTSGAANPTLTIVALALRTAEHIVARSASKSRSR